VYRSRRPRDDRARARARGRDVERRRARREIDRWNFSPPIDVVDRTRAGVGAREGRDGVDASGARARGAAGDRARIRIGGIRGGDARAGVRDVRDGGGG